MEIAGNLNQSSNDNPVSHNSIARRPYCGDSSGDVNFRQSKTPLNPRNTCDSKIIHQTSSPNSHVYNFDQTPYNSRLQVNPVPLGKDYFYTDGLRTDFKGVQV